MDALKLTPHHDPWWQTALDVVLPPRCVGCGRRGTEACDACIAAIRPLGAQICPRCARPSTEGRVCAQCSRRPGQLRAILAGHPYEGLVRAAILAVKYRGRTRLMPLLSALIEAPLRTRPLTIDLVCPVPLTSARKRERGFNQAELLARPLAQAHGWELDTSALTRVRETRQQTRLSSAERRRNVADAVAVTDAARIADRRILLVDDVCTTGATLEACATPLIAAGAAGIWGLVIARDA